MSMSDHAQYHSPGTGSPKWNAAVINGIPFPSAALTSPNVWCEKDLLCRLGHCHTHMS